MVGDKEMKNGKRQGNGTKRRKDLPMLIND